MQVNQQKRIINELIHYVNDNETGTAAADVENDANLQDGHINVGRLHEPVERSPEVVRAHE